MWVDTSRENDILSFSLVEFAFSKLNGNDVASKGRGIHAALVITAMAISLVEFVKDKLYGFIKQRKGRGVLAALAG